MLAIAWGLGPAIPALSRGELLGQPYTDLYPSVWGMWWFANQQPGFPLHCELLAAPDGMPFYYSSPIHGFLAAFFLPILGLAATWNLLVVAARVATVVCAFFAGRSWGLGEAGALTAAAVYGCTPIWLKTTMTSPTAPGSSTARRRNMRKTSTGRVTMCGTRTA